MITDHLLFSSQLLKIFVIPLRWEVAVAGASLVHLEARVMDLFCRINANRIERNPADVVFRRTPDNRLALAADTLDGEHPVSGAGLGIVVNGACMVSASINTGGADQHWFTGRMLIGCQQDLIDLVPKLRG